MWYALGVIALIVGGLLWLRRRSMPRIGEIAPGHVLQKKYNLYAENRPIIKINPAEVPEFLRDLEQVARSYSALVH